MEKGHRCFWSKADCEKTLNSSWFCLHVGPVLFSLKFSSLLFSSPLVNFLMSDPFNQGLTFRICKPRCNSFNQAWYIWLMFLQEIKDVPVETFDVELVKDSRGLGITIAGYVEQSSGTFTSAALQSC